MLTQSFILLDGISYQGERKIRQLGITNWSQFLQREVPSIGPARKIIYDQSLRRAQLALRSEESNYFDTLLKPIDRWRLYPAFKDSCIFLDIEISSLKGYVTVITLFDGEQTMTFVRNHNLDFAIIKKILSRYKLLITFNGTLFDLPFLNKCCPGIIPAMAHWDLRFSCAALGMSGGLKKVESLIGIHRSTIVTRMHGGDPILLWRTFLATGDGYYLDLLIEYNQEDAVNLQRIADFVYKQLRVKFDSLLS